MTTMDSSANPQKSLPQIAGSFNQELFTTKELAEQLGTRPNVITENAKKCLPNKTIENGKVTYWTKAEATVLLEHLKKNNSNQFNLSSSLIGTSTELSPALKIKKAFDLMQEGYNEELARLRALSEEQQAKIEMDAPKVEFYDSVADSTNLTEIGTVGKMVGVGSRNIFSILVGDKVIMKKFDDGIDYYVPFYDYEKYFKIVPEPFMKGDRKVVRNKLMFNQTGVIWATKKYKETTDIKRPQRWNFEGASLELGMPQEDIRDFLRIKQYIFKVGEKWLATGMGVDFGYVENSDGEVWITEKGLEKVKNALEIPELSPEERKRIDAICAEAERNARYNGVGKAE